MAGVVRCGDWLDDSIRVSQNSTRDGDVTRPHRSPPKIAATPKSGSERNSSDFLWVAAKRLVGKPKGEAPAEPTVELATRNANNIQVRWNAVCHGLLEKPAVHS